MPDMRFAPPPSVGLKTKTGGLNQISVRSFNERLVLSLLRQHGALSRQDIGKRSGLSAQTVSVIVRALEKDGMILQGEKQRGRVGPPTIPMSLNPDGAFAIGIELGSREARVSEVDFTGQIRSLSTVSAPDGTLDALLNQLTKTVGEVIAAMPKTRRDRLVGVGIAMPAGLKEDDTALGAEIEDLLTPIVDMPVILQNDVTCAASSEVSFGEARLLDDFIYFFVDESIGSRLVLGGHIFSGRTKSTSSRDAEGSLASLAEELALPEPVKEFWAHQFDWHGQEAKVCKWSEGAARELVATIQSALAFVDAKSIVIDARLPETLTADMVAAVQAKLAVEPELDLEVLQGAVGASAKAIGAANLAFDQAYMVQESA